MKPSWISTPRHMSSAIWRLLKCGENFVKVESGHVLVVLGARMRVLTPISGYHFNANFM